MKRKKRNPREDSKINKNKILNQKPSKYHQNQEISRQQQHNQPQQLPHKSQIQVEVDKMTNKPEIMFKIINNNPLLTQNPRDIHISPTNKL